MRRPRRTPAADPVARADHASSPDRAAGPPRDGEPGGEAGGLSRREFLGATGAAALGIGALGMPPAARADSGSGPPPSIRRYRVLGKTGLEISDIGFGSGNCRSAALVKHCYERGINYFDTAEMYRSEGWARGEYVENLIGEALQGVRDKVVTTKFVAKADHDRHRIMGELEASLRRLRTDYVDIYLNHAVNDRARLENPEWFEFVEMAKKQGKIRFSGMSGHGGKLTECLDHALDNDLVEVVLVAHNFGSDPAFYERFTKHFDMVANQVELPRLMKKAHDKGVGVIAMKTLMGAKINDLSRYQRDGASLERAAFRWVFSDPNVDALVISMKNEELADRYIACSGDRALRKADREVLEGYVVAHSGDYCRNGCSACLSSCPASVPIPDVLRQRMYYESYGSRRAAREGYARLGAGASPCLECASSDCAASCPFGLDIPTLTRRTAGLLARS